MQTVLGLSTSCSVGSACSGEGLTHKEGDEAELRQRIGAYSAILGEDASVPTERAAIVTAPALAMHVGASYAFIYDTAQALVKAIPNAQVRILSGQMHNVDLDILAPVLMKFFSG